MNPKRSLTYTLVAMACATLGADAFTIKNQFSTPSRPVILHARKPSRVSDPAGPTPKEEEEEIETVRLEDIPELQYDPDNHPIPHQPWRRGFTDGCEDPIDAEWRRKAESIMKKAVDTTGAKVIDITWYLTEVVVTLQDIEAVPHDFLKTKGPVINVLEPQGPMFRDPADPNPEDIWEDENDVVWEQDTETEDDIKSKRYAIAEEGDEPLGLDDKGDVSLYTTEETREDIALRAAEEAELFAEQKQSVVNTESLDEVDTAALSTIGGAILDALETVEDELRIIDRHAIVLISPGEEDVLETQKQFDAYRDYDVSVETQDPWDSNRTLRGKLVDRNSMDVIINQKGRMVTIPLNFVKCVRLVQKPRFPEERLEGDEEGGLVEEEEES